MKAIFESFKTLLIVGICALMVVAADAPTQLKINELERKNVELRSDLNEWRDEVRWNRRLGKRPNSMRSELAGYNQRELEANEREIEALKAGTNAPPSIAPTPAQANSEPIAPSFYAPPFRIVKDSNAPPRINSEAPALPATNTTRTATNAEPVDWRTPEQRTKWEAIEKQFSKWPDPSQVQTKTQRQSETTKAPKTSSKRK